MEYQLSISTALMVEKAMAIKQARKNPRSGAKLNSGLLHDGGYELDIISCYRGGICEL